MGNGEMVGFRSQREPSMAEALARLVKETGESATGVDIGEDVARVANWVRDFRNRPLSEAPLVSEEIIVRGSRSGWDNDTVNRMLGTLRAACELAYMNWGWLEEGLASRIRSIESEVERDAFPTLAQAEEIAYLCRRKEVADMIRIAAYTGLWRSELLGLDPKGRVKDGMIHLDTDTKSGKPRVVPIHPRIDGAVHRLPFPWPPKMLDKWWAKARDASGLFHLRFDDLRKAESSSS